MADGIDCLNHALGLRPDYEDAMAYTNLLYRRKADLECNDEESRMKDNKAADAWADKVMASRRKKESAPPIRPEQ